MSSRVSFAAWLLASVAVPAAVAEPAGNAPSASAELATFIDDFVDYRADDRASDLSRESIAADLAGTRAQLEKLRRIDLGALTLDEDIDWRFAQSILRGEEIENADIRAWTRDPRVYMRFRPIGRAIGRPGDADEKASELVAVLEMLPKQLQSGRENLSEYIPRFQELSVFMAGGGLKMLRADVPAFARGVPAHEAYAGHHVQGLYQLNNPRKLRRTQGISIFSEGWGLYNEQLMRETGFYPNDRIVLRQLQLRLWRNARVVWDVGIHTGRMSYEEGIALLADRVGFLRWAAQLEIDGSAQRPVYKIGYFLGMSEILKMREEYRERMGAGFTLSDFHEKLLKIGNMPPVLMREALLATLPPPEQRAP